MNDVEVAEIIIQYGILIAELMANYSSHLAIYLTLLFAYCVAMFAAGAKLDRLQVVIATVLFVTASEFQILTMGTWVDAAQEALLRLSQINPEYAVPNAAARSQIFGQILWNLGIAACLLFVWRVRKQQSE